MNEINQYLQPDMRWEIFGMPDSETFLKNMMIKERFIEAVPEDIKKSFVTVQYLIAHSYFYYEMYDEAYKKMLGIYEMAIKYKYAQLAAVAPGVAGNGKTKQLKLHEMITAICKDKQFMGFESRMHEIRNKRNIAAHPQNYSFVGIMVKASMLGVVNMINFLFVSPLSAENWQYSNEIWSKRFSSFNSGAYILEIAGNQHLVDGMMMDAMVVVESEEIMLCSLIIVRENTVANLKLHKSENPIVMVASRVKVHGDYLTGQHLESGLEFKLCPATASKDILIWENYKRDLEDAGSMVQFMYQSVHSSHLTSLVEAFVHRYGKEAFSES